jgi:hypothetical protein
MLHAVMAGGGRRRLARLGEKFTFYLSTIHYRTT